ncbi:hypothetical protein TeGR_g2864 [Tetraparma gracilis]|uniref:Uncharacterized protein n=1 Tax=Tetraparma gracilis TaxID=2962635 RepID=A0ABQ6MDP6_9STRA|nr:hypothetical protein TeGR_g2864 [Tetraparma gracilis]
MPSPYSPSPLSSRLRSTKASLTRTTSTLSALTAPSMSSSSNQLRSDFCNALRSTLHGDISASPDQFGQTLAAEKIASACTSSSLGSSPSPLSSYPRLSAASSGSTPSGVLSDAGRKLYGGAAYHRALRELGVLLSASPHAEVSDEEIALAVGVSDVHDGPNFLRAAAVIAIEKSYNNVEPILDDFERRLHNIVAQCGRVAEHKLLSRSRAEDTEPFRGKATARFREVLDGFARDRAARAKE